MRLLTLTLWGGGGGGGGLFAGGALDEIFNERAMVFVSRNVQNISNYFLKSFCSTNINTDIVYKVRGLLSKKLWRFAYS